MNVLTREPPVLAATARKRPAAVKALIGLMAFQGVFGIVGGVGLTAVPSGDLFGYPVTWLNGTPFNDFFVPGLILGLALGVAPLVVAYGLWRRPVWRWTDLWNGWTRLHWAWTGATIIGIGLIAWIIVEVLIVPDHTVPATILQVFCGSVGLAILSMTMLRSVRSSYRRSPKLTVRDASAGGR